MSSVYENTTLYIPLIQPHRPAPSISIESSSYWHVSALYSLGYDSITLPTRTRPEHPYAMDMHDIAARVNIHGQRKVADLDAAVLFDHPDKNDLMRLGWPSVAGQPGQRGLTATVFRGAVDNVDELSKTLSHGDIVTER